MPCKLFVTASLVAASVWLCSPSCSAQDKPKRLKNDQLLIQAGNQNGLGVDAKAHPWHVRAQYETFDDDGKHKSGGVFEEWWFGPKSYKSVFSGEGLKQTDVATEEGLFRSGSPQWPSMQEALVPLLLTDPMGLYRYNPKFNDLTDTTRAVGETKLRCVTLLRSPGPDERVGANLGVDINLFPSYCFQDDSTMLRVAAGGAGRGVLLTDGLAKFQDRVVARDLRYVNAGKSSVLIHVVGLDAPAPDAAKPTPPEGSVGPIAGRIELPEGRMRIIGGLRDALIEVLPAMQSEPDAKFEVKAVIGKDGHVLEATVVSSPPNLAGPLVRAARKLIFEPFLLLGVPVEVVTTVKSTQFSGPGLPDLGAAGGRRR